MIDQFISARKVSTPIVLIRSTDYSLTTRAIKSALDVKDKTAKKQKGDPIITWDCINGWMPMNDAGKEACAKFGSNDDLKSKTTNAVESIELAQQLPAGSILFLYNAHQGFDNPNWIQGCWNTRDTYKTNRRTLVLLTISNVALPPELAQDVMVIDEPLPDAEQLETLVKAVFDSVDEKVPDGVLPKAVEALAGLSNFPSEQVTAMSLYRDEGKKVTLNLDGLWSRKRSMISNTPGLSVWRGGETFDQIGGCENVKGFMKRIIAGKRAPRGIVFIDEIEKAFAGATAGSSDSSGVSQGFLAQILSYMEDNQTAGVIFIGPPGAAKSAVAKATGNTAGVPTISFDLGGMKDSLVGASEARLRNALKVVTAVTQGQALFIGTCNRISILPPELRRRFTLGCYFFDLPRPEEREVIWDIYLKKYNLPEQELPNDEDWTGAEIKQCCDIADRISNTVIEASQFIVPVAKSAAKQIAELREEASGRFISASEPGFYKHRASDTAAGASRAISLED